MNENTLKYLILKYLLQKKKKKQMMLMVMNSLKHYRLPNFYVQKGSGSSAEISYRDHAFFDKYDIHYTQNTELKHFNTK